MAAAARWPVISIEFDVHPIEPLIQYLSARDHLTSEDIDLLQSLRLRLVSIERGHCIVAAASWPSESCLLLGGIAGRERITPTGARQITAIHFSGELVDAHGFVLKLMDHSIEALTDCQVGYIPHADIRRVTEQSPHLARLFWLGTAVEGAIQRNWIAAMGRSSSVVQLAHFYCETFFRLRTVGLAEGTSYTLNLTQEQIADCLGLSVVHISRSLKELRATGLMDSVRSTVTIHDLDGLIEFSGFDGTYLNLIKVPR